MEVLIKGLTKRYGDHVVLDNINMEFKKPGIYLIAGPNGSGKTTLLEVIIGLRKQTEGDVWLGDQQPGSWESKKSLGFLSQQNSLRKCCYVNEEMELLAELFELKSINLKQYLEKYDLAQYYREQTKKLSGGTRRRLLLAMTLLPQQDIILLDEPVSGLDSFSRNEIWNMITEVARDKIIILTDHYLNQAAQYSDFVYLLDEGRIVLHGEIKQVISSVKKTHVIKARKDSRSEVENRLKKLGLEIDLKVSGTVYSYYLNDSENNVISVIGTGDFRISYIDFEDVYFYYTGKHSYEGADTR